MTRPLRFVTLESGCMVSCSHKVNRYGYLYKYFGGVAWAVHRLLYTIWNGPIPDGYEVHHVCEVSQCCNPDHLECLPRSEHKRITSWSRGARTRRKIEEALESNPDIKHKELMRIAGVGKHAVSRHKAAIMEENGRNSRL